MRGPAKYVAWLLPLVLTGCFHKQQQAQIQLAPPLVETAPPPPPVQTDTSNLPPPVITVPAQPVKQEATATPPPKPKPKVKRRKPVKSDVEVASNDMAGVPAIGQLSSGDPPDLRRQTQDSIASTERGLSSITRHLNEQEQRIVEHIQEFLKQAKQALASGDVDGASTLAAKAKVLLAEVDH